MKLSQAGLDLIASFEGFRGELYNDPAGHCTIGFGHLVHEGTCNGSEPAKWKSGISYAEALSLLRIDVSRFEQAVNDLIAAPLTQPQFDALVSFTFNVGRGALERSMLRTKLNSLDYASVPEEMNRWVHAGGKVLQGLVRRRKIESDLFNSGTGEGMPDKLATLFNEEFGAGKWDDLRGKLTEHKDFDFTYMDSSKAEYIAIHHTAAAINQAWETIAKFHVEDRGYAGIAYHLGVRQGRPAVFSNLDVMRSHVKGRNDEALGVVVTGNYDMRNVEPTDFAILQRVIKVLDRYYGKQKTIVAHKDLMTPGYTSCCGSDLYRQLGRLRAPVEAFTKQQYGTAAYELENLARLRRDAGDQATHDIILKYALPPIYAKRDS